MKTLTLALCKFIVRVEQKDQTPDLRQAIIYLYEALRFIEHADRQWEEAKQKATQRRAVSKVKDHWRRGGLARAAALTPVQRSDIARKAALIRWYKANRELDGTD